MIAVAGFNTSLDRLIDVDELRPGAVIRARDAAVWPGGKGAHVAICAATLGESVRLTGFIDSANRQWVAVWLRDRGVDFHGVDMATMPRSCLAIRDRFGGMTEILEPGPAVDAAQCSDAVETFVGSCDGASAAILSGSVPRGMPASTYAVLTKQLRDLRVFIDASGDLLREAMDAHPFCVKPNREEAEALTGTTLGSPEAAAHAARALQATGMAVVVISLGADGAAAAFEGRACHVIAPRVSALNAVGAGDCLLAGLAVALARGEGIEDALRHGVAAGTGKVLCAETGMVRREDISSLISHVRLRWL